MLHRNINDIFASSCSLVPDEYDLQKQCTARLEAACMPQDVYLWLERVDDPFFREAYAETLWTMLDTRRADCYDDLNRVNSYVWDDIYDHLRTIIRLAQSEQLAEQMLVCDHMTPVVSANANDVPQLRKMQSQLDYLTHEIEQLKAEKTIAPECSLIAPLYTDRATQDDRRDIEFFLRYTCQKHERTMTSQLKAFLREKQKQGFLVLPATLKDEYELVCQFGYDRTCKAYANN